MRSGLRIDPRASDFCRCGEIPEYGDDSADSGDLSDYEFLRLLMGRPSEIVAPDEEGTIAGSIESAVQKAARAAGVALTAVQVAAIVARILQAVLEAVAAAPNPSGEIVQRGG